MVEETASISARTLARNLEPIINAGFMEGAADGQSASFQTSFDVGYEQGFNFGMKLGFNDAMRSKRLSSSNYNDTDLTDASKINCQICLNNTTTEYSIANMYNVQKEKNELLTNKWKLVNEHHSKQQ